MATFFYSYICWTLNSADMRTNFPRLRQFAFTIVTSLLFTAQSGLCAEVFEHAKTLLGKAKSEVEACQFERAIEDCGEAIKEGLQTSDVYIWRGCAYMHIGDFKHAEEDFQKAQILTKGSGEYWLHRLRDFEFDDVHKEKGAAHRWALACTAIQFTKDKLCSKSLAGVEINDHSVENERQLLQGRMNVASHQDLDRVLVGMEEKIDKNKGNKSLLAWDLSLYICICRWGYLAGYLDDEQAWELIMPKAKLIQQEFTSWNDFAENYMQGRKIWDQSAYERDKDLFERAIRRLNQNKRSPWNEYAWNTSLK